MHSFVAAMALKTMPTFPVLPVAQPPPYPEGSLEVDDMAFAEPVDDVHITKALHPYSNFSWRRDSFYSAVK